MGGHRSIVWGDEFIDKKGRSAQIPAKSEKVIVRSEEKKIYSPTQPFSLIKTCIHETHKTPVKSSLIMGFTNSIKCNW